MDQLIAYVETAYRKKTLPDFRVGDIVRVHQRIREGGKERIQIFEGIVIAKKHGRGMNGTFTVRRVASGVGVERVYPLHSPAIAKIERLRSSKVRRAKLYFLRTRIGKKARLKGWEAYASWSEPETPEVAADADAETEGAEPEGETTLEELTTKPSKKTTKPVESTHDDGAQDDGESGGAARSGTPPEEAPSNSGEKS